jgi:hypothetical protein
MFGEHVTELIGRNLDMPIRVSTEGRIFKDGKIIPDTPIVNFNNNLSYPIRVTRDGRIYNIEKNEYEELKFKTPQDEERFSGSVKIAGYDIFVDSTGNLFIKHGEEWHYEISNADGVTKFRLGNWIMVSGDIIYIYEYDDGFKKITEYSIPGIVKATKGIIRTESEAYHVIGKELVKIESDGGKIIDCIKICRQRSEYVFTLEELNGKAVLTRREYNLNSPGCDYHIIDEPSIEYLHYLKPWKMLTYSVNKIYISNSDGFNLTNFSNRKCIAGKIPHEFLRIEKPMKNARNRIN